MTPQPFRRTGRHWILITALILAVLAVAVVLMRAFSGPDFTPAENNYLGVVKQWPGTWPADEELVAQGHRICDELQANLGLKTGAVLFLLDPPPSSTDQGEYQVGAAIGALCTDQAWRML